MNVIASTLVDNAMFEDLLAASKCSRGCQGLFTQTAIGSVRG